MTRFGGGSGSRAFVMSALVDVVCMICLIKKGAVLLVGVVGLYTMFFKLR